MPLTAQMEMIRIRQQKRFKLVVCCAAESDVYVAEHHVLFVGNFSNYVIVATTAVLETFTGQKYLPTQRRMICRKNDLAGTKCLRSINHLDQIGPIGRQGDSW